MPQSQRNAAAAPVGAMEIAVVGGGSNGCTASLLQGSESSAWTWTRLPDLLRKRERPAITFLESHKQLFVVGGNLTDSVDMEMLSFVSRAARNAQWTAVSTPPNLTRWSTHLLVLGDHLVLVCKPPSIP